MRRDIRAPVIPPNHEELRIVVRTGHGSVGWDRRFTDAVETVLRVPGFHDRWQSVRYKGKRYQLLGGIRTDYFICLNNPIGGKRADQNSV